MGGFVFAYVPADVGQLKKLAATVAPAECADHRAWIAIKQVQTIVARIDIRLQHTLPSGEVFFRVLTFAVARELNLLRLGPVEIHRVRIIVAPMWIMASKLVSVLQARIAIRLNSLSF